MANRIAVQDGLENVERALRADGFDVTMLKAGGERGAGAIVVTGGSDRMMGMTDLPDESAPIIHAAGLTAEEVVRQVRERMRH